MKRRRGRARFTSRAIARRRRVVAGHHLDALALPLWLEAPTLIAVTLAGCWLFYQLGRRIPPLRVWVGLPSQRVETRVAMGDIGASRGKAAS